jgi:hypothetical protein
MANIGRRNIITANKIDPPIATITPSRLPGNPRPAVPAIIQTEAKKAIMRTYQIITQSNVYQTAQHGATRAATPPKFISANKASSGRLPPLLKLV